MGWIITFGIACLLAILPLGVSFCYDEDGVLLCIIAGPLKITLLPRPQKEKKPKKENKAKETANRGRSVRKTDCRSRKSKTTA